MPCPANGRLGRKEDGQRRQVQCARRVPRSCVSDVSLRVTASHLRASHLRSTRNECCQPSVVRHSCRGQLQMPTGEDIVLTVDHHVVRARRQWALFYSCGLSAIRRGLLLSRLSYPHHSGRLQIGRAPSPYSQSAPISNTFQLRLSYESIFAGSSRRYCTAVTRWSAHSGLSVALPIAIDRSPSS